MTIHEPMLSAAQGSADGFCLVFSVFSEPSQNLFTFLSLRLARHDVDQLHHAFEHGCVRVDGLIAYSDQILISGQKVTLYLKGHQEADVDSRWHVLWQNDELLKVYNPHCCLLVVRHVTCIKH